MVLAMIALAVASWLVTILLLWSHVEAALHWLLVLALTKKLRTKVSIDTIHLQRWSVEVRGVLIANGPGNWEAPYALKLSRFRVEFTFLGLLSVLFPPNLRLGPLEFHLGFRIKKVETVEMEGLSIFLEDAEEEELHNISAVALRQASLLKRPISTRTRPRSERRATEAARSPSPPPPLCVACFDDLRLDSLAIQTAALGSRSVGTSSSLPPGWRGLTRLPRLARLTTRRPRAACGYSLRPRWSQTYQRTKASSASPSS